MKTLITQIKALAWPRFAKLKLARSLGLLTSSAEPGVTGSAGQGQELQGRSSDKVDLVAYAQPKGTAAANASDHPRALSC